jgi:tetratricopeptide (TPR) repeat protein
MTDRNSGTIVTFYSYKGGTGRTMALANVAWILASAGRRVLVVDWDLEAPGLDRFLHPFLEGRRIQTTPGVLNLITDYAQAVSKELARADSPLAESDDARLEWITERARIGHAVIPVDWRFPAGGRLDYISAGRQNRNYSAAFSHFDWNNFYDEMFGGEYLDELRREFRRDYDYVLLDSRTGLSDVADICTIHFPDVLVDCFTLNDQSIDGAAAVARRVQDVYSDRGIRILPVPMRVEDAELERLEAARDQVRLKFDRIVAGRSPGRDPKQYWSQVEVPYKPFYAYEETLATFRDVPGSPASMLAAYERLTSAVTDGEVTALTPMDDGLRRRYLDMFTRRRPMGPSDIYVSHVPEDRMWAEWIASVLAAADFRVRLEPDDTAAGATLKSETERNVEAASRTVAVLSAAYQRSPQARAVWESVAASDPLGSRRSLLPVRVSDVTLRHPFADRTPVDLTQLEESDARDALLRALDAPVRLREHPADPERSGPRFPGAVPPVWSVPLRNTAFTGRGEMLETLRERLRATGTATLLHGMGGVGKTQLALEYAHRFMADYDLVWWISAEGQNFAVQRYAELAEELGIRPRESVSDTAGAVHDALRRGTPHRRWLLIFDNADTPEALEKLLISGGEGHTVITTRKDGWERIAEPVEVEVFTRGESVEHLVRRVADISPQDADAVAGVLGDLPLAVDQAAAWLNQTGLEARVYLDLLQQQLASAGGGEGADAYPLRVAATWELSIQQLRKTHPVAVHLLQLCAYFGAEPISLDLLYGKEMVDALRDDFQALDENMMLARAIQELSRFALVKVDRKGRSLQVHRLVQAAVRTAMPPEEQEAARTTVFRILAGARPSQGDVENPDNWVQYARIWPHLTPMWARTTLDGRIRQLLADRIRYLRTRGELDSAATLCEELISAWTEQCDENDRWILHMRFQLANVLRAQGWYARALAIDEEVHRRQRDSLGDEDLHTLMTAGSLTAGLRGVGRFQEALELDRQTVASFAHLFGEDHPRSLAAANNLAVSLRMSGECFEARDVDRTALEARQATLGQDHPLTLASAVNLGRDLRSCGDYNGSLTLLRTTYERARRHPELGEDYPPAQEAAKALAVTLRRVGQHREAEEITRGLLGRSRVRFGDESPETLMIKVGLVGDTAADGRVAEARDMGRDLMEVCRKVLGERHPNTLACTANYAVLLLSAGLAAESRSFAEQAKTALERGLGGDHPFALSCSVNLANAEAALGQAAPAEERYRVALERLGRVLGPEHPSSLVCAANLAVLHRESGQADEATRRRDEVLGAMTARLGSEHPRTTALRDWQRSGLELDPHPI